MNKNDAINKLLETIKQDYSTFKSRWVNNERSNQMIEKFNDTLTAKVGKKYIKIISDGSAWGFVVNTNDDKMFQEGDILKATSWSAPARNFPRGNIFNDDYQGTWTGA